MPLPEEYRQAIIEWAEAEPLIFTVRLFGSFHRGTKREDSDVDIAVGVCQVNSRARVIG
jgi:predicted nucleotidyltransferase